MVNGTIIPRYVLVGLYTDIDNILREACGMSYGKATELCKEVQKNTLPPNGIY